MKATRVTLASAVLLAAWSPSTAAQALGGEQFRVVTPGFDPVTTQLRRLPRRTAGTATKLGLVMGGLAGGMIAAVALLPMDCDGTACMLGPVVLPFAIGIGGAIGMMAGATIGLAIDTTIAGDDDGPPIGPRLYTIGLVVPVRFPR